MQPPRSPIPDNASEEDKRAMEEIIIRLRDAKWSETTELFMRLLDHVTDRLNEDSGESYDISNLSDAQIEVLEQELTRLVMQMDQGLLPEGLLAKLKQMLRGQIKKKDKNQKQDKEEDHPLNRALKVMIIQEVAQKNNPSLFHMQDDELDRLMRQPPPGARVPTGKKKPAQKAMDAMQAALQRNNSDMISNLAKPKSPVSPKRNLER